MAVSVQSSTSIGSLMVRPLAHPQGCRTYWIVEPESGEALVLDPHLDFVDRIVGEANQAGWAVRYIVDSHTHADHPSGAHALAGRLDGAARVAHEASSHAGVTRHPADGDELTLGSAKLVIRHAPGHTPDHIVLVADGVLFSGDTLLIGAVARTDFLGGDAGTLYDSIHRVIADLDDDCRIFPGHDYAGRIVTRLGDERANNPWLQIDDRAAFVAALTANPPPRPANMDDLLRLNREGTEIPGRVSAATVKQAVAAGGARSVLDVRTDAEVAEQRIPGGRHIPLDQLAARVEEVRAMPAPRLILCRSGKRAQAAQELLAGAGVRGTSVIDGGILAYAEAGGETARDPAVMSLERQVRIAAGALVLVGVVLGTWVHPAGLGLAAFVGAGLVFAGVTDFCGMGLLLAKAPWNRRASNASTGAAPAGGACAATPPGSSGGACAATPPPSTNGGGACAATPPPSASGGAS